MELQKFVEDLSSGAPVPGGGGASALLGSLSAALCSMVCNLTSGKKKYASYQADIEEYLEKAKKASEKLLTLIQKDADVFEPLSKAYAIPKEQKDRDDIMEAALVNACSVPMEIMHEVYDIIPLLEELSEKGSRLAVSDVGVAAACASAALEGAIMNVYINTKMMKNRPYAEHENKKAEEMLSIGRIRCQKVYEAIVGELKK